MKTTSNVPATPARSALELLGLARAGDAAGRAVLAATPAEVLASACVELDARSRGEFLMNLDRVDEVVPLLPEAEFALALNAVGKEEAGWLLEFSTEEQRIACIDMDCFSVDGFEPDRMIDWIDALIVSGTPTLVAALDDLDPEIWVLGLRSMANFSIGAAAGDMFTEDGVVFYTPNSDEDFDRVREILQTLFGANPQKYWQLVYGAMEGASAECETWAVHWRDARLADLGFPSRERAMWVYRPLAADAVEWSEPAASDTRPGDDVPSGALVPGRLGRSLLGDALRQLPNARATELLSYVAGVANAIAIADRLALGDPDTAKRASDKALAGIERGLQELAKLHAIHAHEVIDRVAPLELFRVGATLDRKLRDGRV